MARKNRGLSDDELLSIVDRQLSTSQTYASTTQQADRIKALQFVQGDVSSDLGSIDGRSSVVSRDVADAINGIMPSIMRVFTASNNIAVYSPRHPDYDDDGNDVAEERARQATDYVNYVFKNECKGYSVCMTPFIAHCCTATALSNTGGIRHLFTHLKTTPACLTMLIRCC